MLLQKPHHWSCLCHHSSKAQRYLYSKFIHLNLNSHLACICLHYQLFLTYFGCIGLASRGIIRDSMIATLNDFLMFWPTTVLQKKMYWIPVLIATYFLIWFGTHWDFVPFPNKPTCLIQNQSSTCLFQSCLCVSLFCQTSWFLILSGSRILIQSQALHSIYLLFFSSILFLLSTTWQLRSNINFLSSHVTCSHQLRFWFPSLFPCF